MHEIRTIATDDPGVCQPVKRVDCAKAAERIDVLFVVETHGDPRNIVLDEGPHPDGFDAAFTKSLWPLVMSATVSQG